MPTITLRFFAQARELAGRHQMELSLPDPATVRDAREALFRLHPDLKPISLQFAVNAVYAQPGTPLHSGDVVACIPPVGGG